MMRQRTAGPSQAIGLLLLCAILVLSAFLYSPWHKHSRLRAQPCEFTQYEHGTCTGEPPAFVLVEPPVVAACLELLLHKPGVSTALPRRTSCRAPPV